jgi:cation transport ATPase
MNAAVSNPTESLTLPVLGMTCASCQHHVEDALRSTAGIQSAHVDLIANRASVDFDPVIASPEAVVQAIRSAGYDAVLPRSDASGAGSHEDSATAGADRKALITLIAGAAAMLLAMPLGTEMGALDHSLMRLFPWLYSLSPSLIRWFLLIVTAVLMVWAGRGIWFCRNSAILLFFGLTARCWKVMRQTLNPVVAKVLKRLHYPLDVILLCVRWYSAYPLSLRKPGGNDGRAWDFCRSLDRAPLGD